MNRSEKTDLVSNLQKEFSDNEFLLLFEYRGINDADLFSLRQSIKSSDSKLKIVKNTLAKLAVKDSNFESLAEYFKGPIAMAYGNSITELAKLVTKFAKINKKLQIKTACLNGKIIDQDKINALSQLGSMDEVRSRFISILTSNGSNLISLLNAPSLKFVNLIKNYQEKQSNSN